MATKSKVFSKKPVNKPAKKFTSLRDAYTRAQDGCDDSKRAIIGCLHNTGCEHLAEQARNFNKTNAKWWHYYQGLSRYIETLVGEYGVNETKAEKEILAELNSARSYSHDMSLFWEPMTHKLDHRPTLEEAQRLVGGFVQTINTKKLQFLVDEDGIQKGLPPNEKARKAIAAALGVPVDGIQVIVGDVVILDNKNKWR